MTIDEVMEQAHRHDCERTALLAKAKADYYERIAGIERAHPDAIVSVCTTFIELVAKKAR